MATIEPVLTGKPVTNVFTEHVYKLRVTFGASSAVTFRSKDAIIAKLTTTTWKITLPKVYAEITSYRVGRRVAAAGVVPLEYVITTDNSAVDGTVTLTSIETAVSGAATAPASGDVIFIEIGVSADTLNSKFTG